ncbi:cryptochrome/photolyase family protein [Tranquillimonas alkanivorans]|uniref:Deoxyribodipyrimidine photo-lyase n=1 Tax=Tranquillimonas alkanivorans TaxID=441119 RepID=A0A1I5RB19_9RHOB|nr:deoxyribodipyrimidine photo-lyase [Tranquillimonas alkanivorans]SFP55713.1 deoxyribodipyrimidine photo-lyase [Tranquillimonas alkanivorans]
MSDNSPILLWFRRDLRLSDHPALREASHSGRPVIPVFLHDEVVEAQGACPKWRLGLGVGALADALGAKGSRLILRRGGALATLRALVAETGAGAVWWTRAYDPDALTRDKAVKAGLKEDGLDARSFEGHLMHEPFAVETKQGGFYKVYTPFRRAVAQRSVATPVSTPGRILAPDAWPRSDRLEDWELGAAMNRGAEIVGQYVNVGEQAAQGRLAAFIAHRIDGYGEARDLPAVEGTSRLSENLTYGEISVRTCWHAGVRALEEGKRGAETFLKELIWRDFAYHLVYHTPHITASNWREDWDRFPWNEDERRAEVKAWKRGRTGIPFVDAAMREMYVTGTMHNRARMIAASYLTKHLLTHWRVGLKWFENCLIDWDPASNALGWQWSAGSGPDATPYFRVFNPVTQLDRFDKERAYVTRWIAEGQRNPPKEALQYFDAIPRSWNMSPDDAYPEPVVSPQEGRQRALEVYGNRDF